MQCTTVPTDAFRLVLVERVEQRGQILHDILDLNLDSMDQIPSVETEPLEPIFHFGMTGALNNQTNGTLDGPLWRMTDVSGQ